LFYDNSRFFIENILSYIPFSIWVHKIENKWKKLTQLLLLLRSNVTRYSPEKLNSFIEWFSKYKIEDNSLESMIKFIDFVLDLIKLHFPELASKEYTKFRVETVLLWEYKENSEDSFYLWLLPLDNFYFRKNEEIPPNENDKFPILWNLIHHYDNRLKWMKNINIFDIYWNKVFWWDIWENDITNLVWTYYILTENDWWRNVPKFAMWNVKSLRPAKDPIWEVTRKIRPLPEGISIPNDIIYINPDYVRIKARWKIQWWKYIINNNKIG
jgi:hypothetical protein